MEGERGNRGNHLDPEAQEFYPTVHLTLAHPQLYNPYTPPSPPATAFVSHLQAEPATRAVVLTMVPQQAGEEAVRAAMEAFGGVRAVEMGAPAGEGSVTVHFYDLRSAQAAVAEVREQHVQSRMGNWGTWEPEGGEGGMFVMHHFLQHQQMGGGGMMAGHAVWAHFTAGELDGANQGSVVVLNWDPVAASTSLLDIFQAFGDVRDIRETPSKPHKFVDYFDIRDAARAVVELNGKVVLGRRLVVEFSRTGSQSRSSNTRSWSHHQNLPPPPRLLQNNSEPNTRMQTQPSPSSSHCSAEGRETPPVFLKRRDTCRNDRPSSSSTGGGGRNKNISNIPSSPPSSKQQQSCSRKGWKNHSKSGEEPRFVFKGGEESGSISRDSRTTLMIKNIPNKYSQKLLLSMLDNHCIHCNEQIGEGVDEPLSAYDFVYLPIDFNNKCNVGYGFVNLTSTEATLRLYKAFDKQPWEVFNSRKICEVTYARLQGLEALNEHFSNSKFACDNDEYMPVVFSPPRDGRQLTNPVAIGGRVGLTKRAMELHLLRSGGSVALQPPDDGGAASFTTTSTHAPSDHANGGDDDEHDSEVANEGVDGRDETCSRNHRLSYTQI